MFRDASGERYGDGIPLRHLRRHKAATGGSSGLQRSIPEGTHTYPQICLECLYHPQFSVFLCPHLLPSSSSLYFPASPAAAHPSLFHIISGTLAQIILPSDAEHRYILWMCLCSIFHMLLITQTHIYTHTKDVKHTPSVELSPAETPAPLPHQQGLLPWKLTKMLLL